MLSKNILNNTAFTLATINGYAKIVEELLKKPDMLLDPETILKSFFMAFKINILMKISF